MKQLTAISLFSGAGGDTLGLEQAGIKVIAYSEVNKIFQQTHKDNFPDSELISDGKTSDISKLPDSCFLKYKNKADIIFAGFPCQGFSHAGKKDINDPRNTLFKEFVRATRLIEPSIIIGENVVGLLSRKTNDNRAYIDVIVKEFEDLGYNVSYKTFNMKYYNVPQARSRLIILGIKNKNPTVGGLYPDDIFNKLVLQPELNLKNIVKYNIEGCKQVEPKLFANIPEECILNSDEDSKPIGKTEDAKQVNSYLRKCNNFDFGKRSKSYNCEEIVDIRKPSKTIICAYSHRPRLFVPIRNKSGCYLRPFTIDELKQIQGFPLDYKFHGNTVQIITQIGNAVPCPFITTLANHLL